MEPFDRVARLFRQMPGIDPSVEGERELVTTSPEEEQLVRRAQMGSSVAFEQLVLARGRELHRYLVFRLRNDNDARDALQETLGAAWQALPTLREPRKFWPWLVAIAAHKAVDIARTRQQVADEPVDDLGQSDQYTLEIRDALDRLPPRFREVLLLRFGLEPRPFAALLEVVVAASQTARERRVASLHGHRL
jgi:RNA polymerase sigma-70 factor (ECF subfamily)